jgi:hypothetical protein
MWAPENKSYLTTAIYAAGSAESRRKEVIKKVERGTTVEPDWTPNVPFTP